MRGRRREPRIDDLTDAELIAFVTWCRWNAPEFVSDPATVRRVLHAYVGASR